jgi:hypothetical protein
LPSALALVPGLGLLVRSKRCAESARDEHRVLLFATPDAIAMASMSAARLGWMVGVARGMQRCLTSARLTTLG